MIKMISVMKRKEGMELARFREWLVNEHVVYARDIPNLRQYKVDVVVDEAPDAPYDGVSELYFDSIESMNEAFASEAGKAAGADAAANCGPRFRLICKENLQF